MNRRMFVNPATGQLVEISGLPGAQVAFVPAPLPPVWQWPPQLWPLLKRAHSALAALGGIGRHLPDPQIILHPLQTREAVRSSSLEGTYTQPIQQALFELGHETLNGAQSGNDATREVWNYGQALRNYYRDRDKQPLSLFLIRQLHGMLMHGVRGANKEPGRFRQVQNQIGLPPRYVPPPPEHMRDCLGDLETFLRADQARRAKLADPLEDDDPLLDPLVNAFLVHYQFEAIHPFLDGNGRVGRLLMSIMITEGCRMSAPWLQMSAYFEARKDDYIDRLFGVSARGEWESWIQFCLEGVVIQARDTEARCEKLLEIRNDFHSRLTSSGGPLRLASIVDNLFRIPIVTAPLIQQRYDVKAPTAHNDLARLVRADIVRETVPQQRPRAYFCPEILNVIYDPSDFSSPSPDGAT